MHNVQKIAEYYFNINILVILLLIIIAE